MKRWLPHTPTQWLLRWTALYAALTGVYVLLTVVDVVSDTHLSVLDLPALGTHASGVNVVWTATAAISLVMCGWIIANGVQVLWTLQAGHRQGGIVTTAWVNIVISILLALVHASFAGVGGYYLLNPPPVAPAVSDFDELMGLLFIVAALDLGAVSWLMIWLQERLRDG